MIVSMYFPIVHAAPNDPHKITQPLLARALREVLEGPAAVAFGMLPYARRCPDQLGVVASG